MKLLPLKESQDYGLLILRVGIGLMFIFVHALPKVLGGVSMWTKLGGSFNRLFNLDFIPAFWGFMATAAEFGGGLCLVLGVFFRPAAALLLSTMIVAVATILRGGYGFASASEPLELAVLLLSFLFTGPGRLTFSNALTAIKTRR